MLAWIVGIVGVVRVVASADGGGVAMVCVAVVRTLGPKLQDVEVQGDFQISDYDRDWWTGSTEQMICF